MAKIPDFKSLEEAADYWDTHSFADYFEETEPVENKRENHARDC